MSAGRLRERIREIDPGYFVENWPSEIRSIRVMCTRPLSILRQDTIKGKYFDVVPCGRCPECLQRKQGEFAALAVLEAKRSKSLHFVTFTYNNSSVPIMFSDEDGIQRPEFVESAVHSTCVGYCDNHFGSLVCASDGVHNWTPSLRRQDIRLFFKHCRNKWKYQTGDVVSFRYAGFGEYGGKTYRPH